MAVVVFECALDDETLASIQDLRLLRVEVLKKQIKNIDEVIATLTAQGALQADESEDYREVILADLNEKCEELEERLTNREAIYSDELELYLDVLSSGA